MLQDRLSPTCSNTCNFGDLEEPLLSSPVTKCFREIRFNVDFEVFFVSMAFTLYVWRLVSHNWYFEYAFSFVLLHELHDVFDCFGFECMD